MRFLPQKTKQDKTNKQRILDERKKGRKGEREGGREGGREGKRGREGGREGEREREREMSGLGHTQMWMELLKGECFSSGHTCDFGGFQPPSQRVDRELFYSSFSRN
jgi:hypothetical protein